jgi:hypothetical protein
MIDLSKRLLAYAVDTVLTSLSLYCVGLAVCRIRWRRF